jgi:hypothetical protein
MVAQMNLRTFILGPVFHASGGSPWLFHDTPRFLVGQHETSLL